MNRRSVRLLVALMSMLVFSFSGFSQQDGKKELKSASLDGTTGLFKSWDAETLRRGEANFTIGYDQVRRDPGKLTIGNAPLGAAVGILDRLEVFGSIDVQRHITAKNIVTYRSNGYPMPARVPGSTQNYFTQAAPFIDVPSATGRGDIRLGFKLNVASEFKGSKASAAFTAFTTIPGHRADLQLRRGLSSGAYEGGFAFLLSKTVKDVTRLYMNAGLNFVADPDWKGTEYQLADLQNGVIYKFGAEFLPYKRYRLITELSGLEYWSHGRVQTLSGINPTSPIDLIFGVRAYPRDWMSVGAGYQASLRRSNTSIARPAGSLEAGHHGFVVQGSVGIRRNDPPTVSCAVAKNSILQAETTTIRANGIDPDGDTLTYSWSSTGGKVSGTGETATFDATDIAPGKYTVSATVSDKKHTASCSSEITVLKRNKPPTAIVEPSSATITQGESANLRCNASDPNNDPLTYAWTVNGQPLAASGPQISFGSEGRKPGDYTVACTVSDGELSANSSAKVTVRERIIPNQPPTIECLTTTMDVASGNSIELRAKASDPDRDKLNYAWSGSAGAVSGAGESATFNATGVKAGSYTANVTVDDGRGGKASCSMIVNVSERLSVTKDKCGFFAPNGTRVDNCAKAILDDLAIRMKNDPKLAANIIGYTDASRLEKSKSTLGEKRAKAVAEYLEKQGVESSRLKITNGGMNLPVGDNKTVAGQKLNRRVEIEITVK
jgi:outer membrane protein OmpA-like peptidoglycan-associated protein